MFIIEAQHPEGWKAEGHCDLEYWACQEAQLRCCADGLRHRVVDDSSDQIVAVLEPASCRAVLVKS